MSFGSFFVTCVRCLRLLCCRGILALLLDVGQLHRLRHAWPGPCRSTTIRYCISRLAPKPDHDPHARVFRLPHPLTGSIPSHIRPQHQDRPRKALRHGRISRARQGYLRKPSPAESCLFAPIRLGSCHPSFPVRNRQKSRCKAISNPGLWRPRRESESMMS